MRKPSVISLYTGAGGLDLGAHAAGLRTAVAVEMDADSCATLRANTSKEYQWQVIDSPIQEVSSSELLAASGLSPGEAELLMGGPPCQPFSKSGYWATGDSRRLEDPRAETLSQFLRVLRDTRPRVFLLENVAGLKYSDKDEGLEYLRTELAALNGALGTRYSFRWKVLNAAQFGVPQLRERLFIVGQRDGVEFRFPEPRFEDHEKAKFEPELAPYSRAWDVVADLGVPDDLDELQLRGKYRSLLPTVPEGANYLFHTDRGIHFYADVGVRTHGRGLPLFGWRRRYWSFLLKLSKWRPSWTLTAQPGPAIGPFHWDNRRLSRKEMARLQTFPDGYSLIGSLGSVQRQLGNAVPSLLAEVLGREIRRQLLGHQVSSTSLRLLRGRSTRTPPAPQVESRVPPEFMKLVGSHSAHPGTGKGHGALRRLECLRPLVP